MNHDMPNNSGEKKAEVPKALKEFLWSTGKFEATPEEVEEFNRLLSFSLEELDGSDGQRYNLTVQAEEIGREWLEATGSRQAELDKLNTELWRKLAVCQAAINYKKTNK